MIARGAADTATALAAPRESVRGLDPLLPASNVRVLDDVLAASVAVRRFLPQVTPAMEIGFAGKVRDFDWIVELIEINTSPPAAWGERRRERDSRRRQECPTLDPECD